MQYLSFTFKTWQVPWSYKLEVQPMEFSKLPFIVHLFIIYTYKYQVLHSPSQHIAMAPLLKSLYRPSQRSLLSSLFTATFLGAVVVVAFPCPIRPTNISGRAEARLDSESNTNTGRRNGEVVVLMNQRGRRFLEERWDRWVKLVARLSVQTSEIIGAQQSVYQTISSAWAIGDLKNGDQRNDRTI